MVMPVALQAVVSQAFECGLDGLCKLLHRNLNVDNILGSQAGDGGGADVVDAQGKPAKRLAKERRRCVRIPAAIRVGRERW